MFHKAQPMQIRTFIFYVKKVKKEMKNTIRTHRAEMGE